MRGVFGILLLLLLLAPAAQADSDYRLVWFRADWCPWSIKMKPGVDKFFTTHKNIERVQVNVDKTDDPLYKQYKKYNPKLATPYMVLLDSKGKVLRTWDRYVTLEELESGLP